MEFPFNVSALLGGPSGNEGPYVGLVDERMLSGRVADNLFTVLDVMGKGSAIAQGLRKPVTTGTPCLLGQRIYLLVHGRTVLGLLKVGTKQLFVAPPPRLLRSSGSSVQDSLRQISPVCALDFYVHESCQRSGMGHRLFEAMLQEEGLQPSQLAYDRPSPKLLGFLRKHYKLCSYQPQNNNFVVFDEYFMDHRSTPQAAAAQTATVPTRVSHAAAAPRPGLFGVEPTGAARPPLAQSASACQLATPMPTERPPHLPWQQTAPPLEGRAPPLPGHPRGPDTARGFGSSSRAAAGTRSASLGRGSVAEYQATVSMPPAGMPSGGLARSGSSQTSRHAPMEADKPSSSGSQISASTSARRYASPLHHAGHRMVAR
mmetsp:Transcript_76380/g.181658  ORF Transcript_76380/g.181658 Transcript_76380/m.181658 type:complete len:372 (+) Transcript_76380:63-1178(+)